MAILRIKDSSNAFIEIPALRGPQGVSGVYVGSGEMPEGYNVQIDPNGDIVETGFATKDYVNNTVTGTANSLISSHNTNTNTHNDIRQQLSEISSEVEDLKLVVTPEMYGAKGDGSTDDSSAIQQAIDAAGSTNIVYLGRKTYAIKTGLLITHSNRRFKCDGTISYSGNGNAITIGSKDIVVDIDTLTAPNGTAIEVSGANKYIERCKISVGRIDSSKIGLHLYTNTVSITYNQFTIGYISATEIGVYVECLASYINENWYYLGKITGCNTGIKLFSAETLESWTGMGTNSNRFFSGGLEGLSSDGCAIHITNSCGNRFEELRCGEHYGKNVLVLEGHARWNDIEYTMIRLREIDISKFTGGHSNVITTTQIQDQYNGYNCGTQARIDYDVGITYDSRYANVNLEMSDGLFENNIIQQYNTLIPTSVTFLPESLNGKTFALGNVYSHFRSMNRGNPITLTFSENGGRILLKDMNGDEILSNISGTFAGKTVSVKWTGFDKLNNQNIWSVQVLGDKTVTESYLESKNYATESFVANKIAEAKLEGEEVDLSGYALKTEIPKKTSQLTNDSGFLTQHQDISDKADKSSAETWTFTLADGSTVTKRVVLA